MKSTSTSLVRTFWCGGHAKSPGFQGSCSSYCLKTRIQNHASVTSTTNKCVDLNRCERERTVLWAPHSSAQVTFTVPRPPPPRLCTRLSGPRGVLAQPFNQRLHHQTQQPRNMQSIFKKSGRRSLPASSTAVNRPIRECWYSSYSRVSV